MKAFEVNGSEVFIGIPVDVTPYPHITLGAGGHKRATWIALGKRDADAITQPRRLPCPNRGQSETLYAAEIPADKQARRCDKCGQMYGDWIQQEGWSGSKYFSRKHPNAGEVDGPVCVFDVGVIQLKYKETGEPSGKFLIVAPRNKDNRALVLWRVSSGYRGSASISAGEGVIIIASDSSWHSGRGSLGETAEVLAILKPGQELIARRSGRRVQETHARLTWDGKEVKVVFGDESLFVATTDELGGEYL